MGQQDMKKRAPAGRALVWLAGVNFLAVMASCWAAVDADLMQSMDERQKSLSSHLALKNAKGASQDAREMEDMLKEVEAHFVQKGNAPDGVQWSVESRQLASGVVDAVNHADFAGASQKAVAMAKNCKACHQIYKTKD
jgi:hypothetical protein